MSSIRPVPAVVLAVLLLVLGGGSLLAGTDSAPDASGALLVEADLPENLAAQGVTHEPQFDYDTASFEANGGLDAVNQVWAAAGVTPDSRIVVVFDFRFVFPDESSAMAYLDAAEPILSESVTGITLRSDGATVGDDTRHYAGSLSQGDLTIAVENVLFRTGPIVAKVYISGLEVPFDEAVGIAQAAGARTDAWLATTEGSFGPGPAGSAEPSQSPEATDGPAGSGRPEPSGTANAPSSPGEQGLLRQWASSASATSEYTADKWSASRATGEPDVAEWADDPNAWTTFNSDDGIHSIELTYDRAVVPREVHIVEAYGLGAVVRVEALDPATEAWVELWSGTDPSAGEELTTFSPTLRAVTFATDTIRVTLDTDLVRGFNEIDAVELVGTAP